MALMKVYDVSQDPPKLFLQQYYRDVTAVDKAAKKEPEFLYMVFRDDIHVVYMR